MNGEVMSLNYVRQIQSCILVWPFHVHTHNHIHNCVYILHANMYVCIQTCIFVCVHLIYVHIQVFTLCVHVSLHVYR